jgi:UDP-glucose 4-epimerase
MTVDNTTTTTTTTKTVLVTGGCGYIGSHTIVFLLEQNYNVVVVDNLINSSNVSLDRVCEIVGLDDPIERAKRLKFYNTDICNETDFRNVFIEQQSTGTPFFSCIHFAGLKVRFAFIG